MKIWAHALVSNEERYIWYSLMSVVNYVDRVLVWDTGSSDKTVKIIKLIEKLYPEKIDFKEVGKVDPEQFTSMRQEMLDQTEADWFLIVDGDEVWWDESIAAIVDTINERGDSLESIVNPYYNIVGDIFHYQPQSAGNYQIDGRKGHLTIRAMNRRIPGLNISRPHGTQGFFDNKGTLIQDRSSNKRMYLDAPYLHFTHMIRSSSHRRDKMVPKRDFKYKHELGKEFPLDFYYPEVFFRNKPGWIFCPWRQMNSDYLRIAALQTIPRKVKRTLWQKSSGY